MTPVSELSIPLTEFNKLTERVHNINNWLDTKGLDINHLIMYAEETEVDNITLLGVMNMRLGSDKYPLNAQKMLKTIETLVSKEWTITLNKIVYPYKVQFDKMKHSYRLVRLTEIIGMVMNRQLLQLWPSRSCYPKFILWNCLSKE